MPEAVEWQPDGTPRSPRFQDIYRSSSGGLDQARHVFLGGCGLPEAWAGQPQWRILETGFGLGLNFLATWRAWKDDPQRPRALHFASIEAFPVGVDDLLRSAAPYPELQDLAAELGAQWFGLLPGVHRLVFEDGRVLLTLYIREVKEALRERAFHADSVFLDGFDPQINPAMWELGTLKAIARHCRRGTRIATWTVAGEVRRQLAQCGFQVERSYGLPPKRHCLQGVFDPAWEPRGSKPMNALQPGRCVVVGAGIAGAAAAASLARRGWTVKVLDSFASPAAGASGLPVGLLAPHYSPDDALLSRLSRAGVRATLQQCRALLQEGEDWRLTGSLEYRMGNPLHLPAPTPDAAACWTRTADSDRMASARLPPELPGWWHEQAAWIKPASLVQAWLERPGVQWQGMTTVAHLVRGAGGWELFDGRGALVASADLVVLAAALGTSQLMQGRLPLQPVRGQVSWAPQPTGQNLPAFPVHGNGHFIPRVPLEGKDAWFCGSTYERGDADLSERQRDHRTNQSKLSALLPAIGAQLAPAFASGAVRAWTGVRCASGDRRPFLGPLAPGLWVSTAMGSRGLTFAALCGELVAARLHGEPLPLERRLAQALDTARSRHQGDSEESLRDPSED
jgi:tRNA 5-methylaminomethyl-2-thiouridine biosynthesis bifunctional protein